MKKKAILLLGFWNLIEITGLLIQSCEKEPDFGPTYFDITVNGVIYELDKHSASYDGSLFISGGDYSDGPFNVNLFLYQAGTQELLLQRIIMKQPIVLQN